MDGSSCTLEGIPNTARLAPRRGCSWVQTDCSREDDEADKEDPHDQAEADHVAVVVLLHVINHPSTHHRPVLTQSSRCGSCWPAAALVIGQESNLPRHAPHTCGVHLQRTPEPVVTCRLEPTTKSFPWLNGLERMLPIWEGAPC